MLSATSSHIEYLNSVALRNDGVSPRHQFDHGFVSRRVELQLLWSLRAVANRYRLHVVGRGVHWSYAWLPGQGDRDGDGGRVTDVNHWS